MRQNHDALIPLAPTSATLSFPGNTSYTDLISSYTEFRVPPVHDTYNSLRAHARDVKQPVTAGVHTCAPIANSSGCDALDACIS